jgi:hypothetical protein
MLRNMASRMSALVLNTAAADILLPAPKPPFAKRMPELSRSAYLSRVSVAEPVVRPRSAGQEL